MSTRNTASGAALQKCSYCGQIHETVCPRISAIEYFPNGTTKRVEFHGPAPVIQYDTTTWQVPKDYRFS